MRKEFEMTEAQLNDLLDAGKPTPVMYLSGGIPMGGTPQENANRAWENLGKELGFRHMTVQPNGKGNRLFNSMSDLFHENVSDEFIAGVFSVMSRAPKHTFQILTKRPERMLEFLSRCKNWEGWITHNGNPPDAYGGDGIIVGNDSGKLIAGELIKNNDGWPLPNVWLGVSIEDQQTADERIPPLLQIPAVVRWLSIEPMLGSISLQTINGNCDALALSRYYPVEGEITQHNPINWVVLGGESGPKARPMHPDWVRSIRDQCQAADVPFFFKQWGEWVSVSEVEGSGAHHYFEDGATVRRTGKKLAGRTLDGRTWEEYPE